MAGMFSKAKAKKVETSKATKKQTVWTTGSEAAKGVGTAIKELVQLTAESKAIEAKMGIRKTVVKNYAERNFVQDFAEAGVLPDTPMVVQNEDGERVTYVVQDRTASTKVSDDQRDALQQLLGKSTIDELLFEETQFGFDRVTLSKPGVMEAVEKALESVIKKLVSAGDLDEEEADSLVSAETKLAFRPGTVERLSQICGGDPVRIEQFLEIVGSGVTRYIRC